MPAPLDTSRPAMGAVLFEGILPPRAEAFAGLERRGVAVRPAPEAPDDAHWALTLRHPAWGEATLFAPRRWPARLSVIVQHAGFLTREEKAVASAARSAVFLRVEGSRLRLLRARKDLLRFLGAVMGDEGVVAYDLEATLPWSRAALDEELAHDADVDVSALYVLHSVVEREGAPVRWLHSHGLAEAGGFDFDLLDPHPELLARGQDAVRALAFAVIEGRVGPETASFPLLVPSGRVALVPAEEFDRAAAPEHRGLRSLDDPEHTLRRSIVCEPAVDPGGPGRSPRPALAESSLRRAPRPARFLTRPLEEGAVFAFSETAGELMADRARRTMGVLRGLVAELAHLRLPALVKLGYETDDRAGREHLWFEVHDVRDDRVDATLVNEPYEVGRLRQGERGEHSIERITDWLIPTPFGLITPRSQVAVRRVRAHVADMLRLDDPPAR